MCVVTAASMAAFGAYASIAATVANTALVAVVAAGAVGAYEEKRAQERSARFNEKVAAYNAKEAERHAQDILAQGEWEKRKLALESLQEVGKAKTSYAAAGVALGAGTPNDYLADIADAYDIDSRQLDYDIKSRAYQARVQGVNYQNQASLYKMQGNNRALKTLGVFSSGVSSAGTALSLGKSINNWGTAKS